MAIPSLANEIRAYIETGALPAPRPGDEATLDYALRRWAKRAAALAQIRDELRAEAAVANKLAQQYLRWWRDEAEMCQKLEQERDELRARVAKLEKQLEIAAREITKAHEEYDMCPSDYDGKLNCVCEEATIADVWRCWRKRWEQKALAALKGDGKDA